MSAMMIISGGHTTTNEGEPTTSVVLNRRTTLLPVALLAVLNLAYILLTRFALSRGAVEANPLANALLVGGHVELIKIGLLCVLAMRLQTRRPALGMATAL